MAALFLQAKSYLVGRGRSTTRPRRWADGGVHVHRWRRPLSRYPAVLRERDRVRVDCGTAALGCGFRITAGAAVPQEITRTPTLSRNTARGAGVPYRRRRSGAQRLCGRRFQLALRGGEERPRSSATPRLIVRSTSVATDDVHGFGPDGQFVGKENRRAVDRAELPFDGYVGIGCQLEIAEDKVEAIAYVDGGILRRRRCAGVTAGAAATRR